MVARMDHLNGSNKLSELDQIPKEWKISALRDVLRIGYGKNQRAVEVEKSEIPILGTGGIIGYAKKSLFDKPSVLIGRKGTIDKPRYIETPFWTIDTLFYTEIDLKIASPKFIYYLFQTIDWYKYNEATGVPSLSANNISKIIFRNPPLKEQQKIAEILSAADEQIEKTEQIIEKTKELKNGLMYKLLTRGIDHITFKQTEVGDFPSPWEIKTLEEVLEKVVGGGTPSRKNLEFYKGDIPWITVKDMDGSLFKTTAKEFINENAIKKSSTNLVEANKVIIATRIALGRAFINLKPVTINQDLKALYLKEDVYPLFFLYWYLSKAKFIESLGSGSTVKGIRLEQLKKIVMALPPLNEQKKIADILSSIDDQIEIHKKEKEKQIELKKALMQQLLTGKLRVTV